MNPFNYIHLGEIVVAALIIYDIVMSVWNPKKSRHSLGNTGANLTIAAFNALVRKGLWYSTFLYLCAAVESRALMTIPTTPFTFGLLFVLVDFVAYWRHWIQHKVRFFWAIHVVHHSSQFYNHTTDLRSSPFAEWFRIPTLLIFPWMGFSSTTLMAIILFFQIYDTFNHNQWVTKLPILDSIFVTPSNHRVHHGKNPQYLDKNFATFFILWDHLFGTYVAETDRVEFGTVKQLASENPIKIVFSDIYTMLIEMRQANTLRQRAKVLFGPPQ